MDIVNLIFQVSVVFSLVFFYFVLFFVHLRAKDYRRMIFSKSHLYIWAIGGHELGTLSIRVSNSLIFHENSWALKLDNFSESQSVISDSLTPTPSVIMKLCVRKSICGSPLTNGFNWPSSISCYWSLSVPLESIRKPLVFWCFQGVQKEISSLKWFEGIKFQDFALFDKMAEFSAKHKVLSTKCSPGYKTEYQ